jgi:hypothetical protein
MRMKNWEGVSIFFVIYLDWKTVGVGLMFTGVFFEGKIGRKGRSVGWYTTYTAWAYLDTWMGIRAICNEYMYNIPTNRFLNEHTSIGQ